MLFIFAMAQLFHLINILFLIFWTPCIHVIQFEFSFFQFNFGCVAGAFEISSRYLSIYSGSQHETSYSLLS